jgi:hypothetical protein
MGNPHPTKSKPCKLGRKHTGKACTRVAERRKAGKKLFAKRALAKQRARDAQIHAYFTGQREFYPD